MASKMPKVSDCSATECAYNTDQTCHALAITVGESPQDPACDTYFESSTHGGVKDAIAGVGACKTADCQYNKEFECSAPQIQVGYRGNQVDCLTFEMR
jgi:hypothetical protein